MVVEPAFPDGDGVLHQLTQSRQVPLGDKTRGVVRMDTRGRENESGIRGGDVARDLRGRERFTNANDGSGARVAGARDYVVAVTVERRVREVGVAVDEEGRVPVLRGHLRSIQRRTGAAT